MRFARKSWFKFDLKHFPSVTLYVLLKYFNTSFPRIVCESRNLSLILNISECHALWITKVFRRFFSSCFARKPKVKFDLKHFPSVTLYVLLRYLDEKVPHAPNPKFKFDVKHFQSVTHYGLLRYLDENVLCASRENRNLSLILNIFRVSRFMFY